MNLRCFGLLLLLPSSAAMAAPQCLQTLREYGAVGNGVSDDTASVQRAVDSGCSIDGEKLSYAVNGGIVITQDISLSNAKFIQKRVISSPEERLYTLEKRGGSFTLAGVTVDRGADERNGVDIEKSAGILLIGVKLATVTGVEVTGNGYGNGIWVLDSEHVTLKDVWVHDMRWSTQYPNPVGFERVLGVRVQRSQNVDLRYVRVDRLLGEDGGNVYRSAGSDGIDLTATDNVLIEQAQISEVGEGIDVTGSSYNTNFTVVDSQVTNVDAFGFKFANSAKNGFIRNSTATDAGYAGFVFSGPSEAGLAVKTENIVVSKCAAINTGSNGRWAGFTTAGFRVQNSAYDTSYPTGIAIINSRAINDSNNTGKMKYGFYSDTAGNQVFNVDSVGHAIEGARGF